MAFIGHRREDGLEQGLKAHLDGVAALAEGFARPFGGEAHARRAGLLHDAGKYSPAGQARMRDPVNVAKVDHPTAGAQIALNELKDMAAALAVAGHHGGMPNRGSKLSSEGDGTLMSRCTKPLVDRMDYSAYWSEIP